MDPPARPGAPIRCEGEPPGRDPTKAMDPSRDAGERDPGDRLVCARCGATVTHERERVDKNGQHEHVFANPHGLAFHIGCFARAPGCASASPPQGAFSWFPGYRWRIVVCRACYHHLGWSFSAGAALFYGLILDRLRIANDPSD